MKKNNPAAPKPAPLPLMVTFDDAERLYQAGKDPFYLAAFLCQCWLSSLMQRVTAQYAEKHPRSRSLQTGEAWREFLALFNPKSEKSYSYLLSCLLRFTAADNSPGNSLRRALAPLSIEHHLTSPKPSVASGPSIQQSTQPSLHQSLLLRWCDWLDADIQLRVHRRWHEAPACFSPDPEVRLLAALGHAQRHIATLDLRAQIAWAHDFAAAELFKNSPKWAALSQGLSAEPEAPWQYSEVDTLVISLWPLLKAYNWTYRDLLNIVSASVKRRQAYPCRTEQEFAAYCVNSLGLRKTGKGITAKNGQPKGFEIAKRLCPKI